MRARRARSQAHAEWEDGSAMLFDHTKLVADLDGTPLYFSKENFSNGCIYIKMLEDPLHWQRWASRAR